MTATERSCISLFTNSKSHTAFNRTKISDLERLDSVMSTHPRYLSHRGCRVEILRWLSRSKVKVKFHEFLIIFTHSRLHQFLISFSVYFPRTDRHKLTRKQTLLKTIPALLSIYGARVQVFFILIKVTITIIITPNKKTSLVNKNKLKTACLLF